MKVQRKRSRRETISIKYDHDDIEKILKEHSYQHIPCGSSIDQADISVVLEGGASLCRASVTIDIVKEEEAKDE